MASRVLQGDQVRVVATFLHQLIVIAVLDDLTFVHRDDVVGVTHST